MHGVQRTRLTLLRPGSSDAGKWPVVFLRTASEPVKKRTRPASLLQSTDVGNTPRRPMRTEASNLLELVGSTGGVFKFA
jgi:hypothetical protein